MKRIINQSKSKGGMRQDIGIYVRSKWEANLCRYYNFTNIKWKYEPKIFFFNDSPHMKKKLKKGTLYYTPDFYLPKTDRWVEIKGFFDAVSKTKLRRFKKYYPEEAEKLQFVIYDPYSKSVENGKVVAFLMDEMGKNFGFYLRQKSLDIDIVSYKDIQERLGGLIPNWEF